MKQLIVCFALMYSLTGSAQTPYTSTINGNTTILNGMITKYALINQAPAFPWYANNLKDYTPDPFIKQAMDSAKKNVQLVIFGGTWCEDTQNILPKFFSLQEQTGFPDDHITFYGVDRNKKTLGNIAAAFGITNVPTIIVMKNGKEVGRVIEYGTTGKWDAELAALLIK